MTKISIDNVEYELETLPEISQAQVNSIRFVDMEISRLQAQLAVQQTARAAYIRSLSESVKSKNSMSPKILEEQTVFSVANEIVNTEAIDEKPKKKGFFF